MHRQTDRHTHTHIHKLHVFLVDNAFPSRYLFVYNQLSLGFIDFVFTDVLTCSQMLYYLILSLRQNNRQKELKGSRVILVHSSRIHFIRVGNLGGRSVWQLVMWHPHSGSSQWGVLVVSDLFPSIQFRIVRVCLLTSINSV